MKSLKDKTKTLHMCNMKNNCLLQVKILDYIIYAYISVVFLSIKNAYFIRRYTSHLKEFYVSAYFLLFALVCLFYIFVLKLKENLGKFVYIIPFLVLRQQLS